MKKLILLLATIIVATPLLGIPGNDGDGVGTTPITLKNKKGTGGAHHAPAFIPIEAYVDLSTNTLYLVSDTIEDVAEVVITDVTTNFESTYSVTISNVPEPILLPFADEMEITVILSTGQSYYGTVTRY
ncbi:MAG: hypothetical protein KBS55_05680 [Bacteroidales bacterium]|nr:hypothetical protein [Candidatus Cryptobacteroides aphodequi]